MNSPMNEPTTHELEQPSIKRIELPFVSTTEVTPKIVALTDAVAALVGADKGLLALETEIEARHGISARTQRRLRSELRKLFGLPERAPLSMLANHEQLRPAIEYVILRQMRSDRGMMRLELSILLERTGETVALESFLKSLYARENVNATSCYKALKCLVIKDQVLKPGGEVATLDDLPSKRSVIRFLTNWRRETLAVRRGRSRKHDWEKSQEPYVTRDLSQVSPGEIMIGDHTELDFMVLNDRGKPDRRWVTAFCDMKSGAWLGWHLSWQPNSGTIALSFRQAVLGTLLRAATGGGTYTPVSAVNVPEVIMMDNGKDYRSKYTGRVFGKVDFEDAARLSVQRLMHLHYVLPYHGQSKAQMERSFGTIQQMIKYLPGYKSNKYERKPDSLAADLKERKLLTVDEFDRLFAEAVTVYNNRVTTSAQGQSRLEHYLTGRRCERTIDVNVLDFLMLKASARTVRRGQITLLGVEYYSDKLVEFNDRKVDVYYDPHDLGFVSVYADGALAAIATNKRMIGVEERAWERILRERKRTEKSLTDQLKEIRRPVAPDEARILLHEGEMADVKPISDEALGHRPATIAVLTGIERTSQAEASGRKAKRAQLRAEESSRRRAVDTLLNLKIGNIK